jgi:hypothetical protein
VSEPLFLGHMLAFETDKELAAQIFGGQPADLIIGECKGQDWCLWVLAIQATVGLIRGPKWRGLHLWHVYRSSLSVNDLQQRRWPPQTTTDVA